MAKHSLLDRLRTSTCVDCDTLDSSGLEELVQDGHHFEDCTSNQAIARLELRKPRNEKVLVDALSLARRLQDQHPRVSLEALTIEITMIAMALKITPYMIGVLHVQAHPAYTFSRQATIEAGERISKLFTELDPSFDVNRACIKIPATWEGLQACKVLEAQGIKTLATTLFCKEQAILAAEVGCHYIAPYVHELKYVTVPGFKDAGPSLKLPMEIKSYYKDHGYNKTRVLPAALTTTQECMALAGIDHMTIAPPLLKELHETPYDAETIMSQTKTQNSSPSSTTYQTFIDNEPAYRLAVTRSEGGRSEEKLTQALNVFYDAQMELEDMVRLLDNQ